MSFLGQCSALHLFRWGSAEGGRQRRLLIGAGYPWQCHFSNFGWEEEESDAPPASHLHRIASINHVTTPTLPFLS